MKMHKFTAIVVEGTKYLKSLGYKTRWEYHPDKLNAKQTTCKIFKDDGEEHTGYVKKDPKNSPNLKLARYISFQRALKDIHF